MPGMPIHAKGEGGSLALSGKADSQTSPWSLSSFEFLALQQTAPANKENRPDTRLGVRPKNVR